MDFIYALGGITKVQDDTIHVHFENAERQYDWAPPSAHVTSAGHVAADDLRRALRVPARQRRARHAEAHDPVAEHGPLPRRALGDRRVRLPGPRRVLGRPDRRLRRRGPRAGRARLHATCSSTTRASPTSTTRASASTSPRSAATPSTSTRRTSRTSTARSPTGRPRSRSPRTCAAATTSRCGRRRAATTSSPTRCSTSSRSTASSWSGTTSARAASSRCATCRRARRSCSASSRRSGPELESKDDLKRRIEEASKYVDVDQLCLSPQCGFSSTREGNDLTADEQFAKLELVLETAAEVWGE